MGFLSRLGLAPKQLKVPDISLVSNWGQGHRELSQITLAEIWGEDLANNLPVTREVAMTVPAVARARNLLVGAIQRMPLVALNGTETVTTVVNGVTTTEVRPKRVTPQPTWLSRTSGNVSPMARIAWTVDDLFFHGVSLWITERGAPGAAKRGDILHAYWWPFNDWRISQTGDVEYREPGDTEWVTLGDDEYILIDSSFEGILNVAARTIRGALDTEAAWVGRMKNPIPLIELRVTDDSQLDPDEIEEHVRTWAKARTGVNGAVSWTPPGLEVVTHGEVKADLYTEGRNAIRTDIGSFVSIPTSMMDGSLAEASLTYVTQEGNRNRFQDESIPFWISPIEAALSMDNVVPSGTYVRFDRSEALATVQTPTGAPVED